MSQRMSDTLQEPLIKSYSVPFAVADGQDSTQLVRVLRFGHPLPRMVLNNYAAGNDFVPTRYREVLLTVCHSVERYGDSTTS